MSTTSERHTTGADAVATVIDNFITDNAHSRDIGLRWLASALNDAMLLSRRARSGFSPDDKKLIAEFRLGEIAKEKQGRQREIDLLDAEAAKLSAGR